MLRYKGILVYWLMDKEMSIKNLGKPIHLTNLMSRNLFAVVQINFFSAKTLSGMYAIGPPLGLTAQINTDTEPKNGSALPPKLAERMMKLY
jgi:hypothetical protein